MKSSSSQTDVTRQSEENKTNGENNGQGFTPVRLRTFFVGTVAVVLVCLIVSFAELVASRGGSIDAILLGATHMPPGAIGILILFLFINAAAAKLSKRLKLNSAETAVIYFMLACGAVISSFGMIGLLLPTLIGVNYFANTQDHMWRDLFYPNIPDWLVPWSTSGDEQQMVAVRFYERLRPGESIPWGDWIVPIVAWLTLGFLMYFLMACVATLFRRQWVDNEKLTFPLVQLPMEMANEETRVPFFQNKLMWLGFLIPAAFYLLNGISKSVPSFPALQNTLVLNDFFQQWPLNEMIYTPIVLAYSIIGFAYLLPLDVSFSMWFFLIFFRLQDLAVLSLGYHLDMAPLYGATRYYQAYQSVGAFFIIVASMLWFARPHFKMLFERVFTGKNKDIDKNEFVSYRFAFWGGLVSYILIIIWLTAAGMTWWVAAFMIGIFVLIIMLVLTRCAAEIGLLMLQPVFRPMDVWAIFAPKAALGAGNLTIISMVNGIFMRDPRNAMPIFLDSMKGADYVNAKRSKMAIGAMVSVFVAAFAAVVIQIYIAYTKGGLNLNTWFYANDNNSTLYFREAGNILQGYSPFDYRAPVFFGIGSIFTLFLYSMRARFWWWPFHPLGYAMGCAWPAVVYWFSFFVGWALKSLILHYGGARYYKTFRPFFLGLILGEFALGILWALLSGLFGLTSPAIPIS